MKTLYAKRIQTHECDLYGIQVSCVKTQLLRVHVSGNDRARGFGPSRAIWEWACNGEAIEGEELERLFKMYPVCEFQNDEDLMWRIERNKGRASSELRNLHRS